MANPINYMLNVPDPSQSFLQGFAGGAGIQQVIDQRAEAERKRQAEAQMQQDFGALAENPTPQAIAQMSIKYPHLSEQFKRSYDMMDTEQRGRRLGQASQVYAALQSGRNDIAIKLLRDQAEAMRNGGAEDEAKGSEMLAGLVEVSPETAMISAGTILASAMGADKFAETFEKLGTEQRAQKQAPAALRKAEADAAAAEAEAKSKGVTAKYAESNAALDLKKKGWDITKIQEDINIAKESNRIAAMNAVLSRETNDLKRDELRLKIDDAVRERDEKIRTKAADVESSRLNMDNMLNTVDRVLNNPSLDDVIGSFEGRMPEAASMLDDEESDAIALINLLKSQAFLSQIPNIKGMGGLSDAEGKKLEASLQNLDRAQSGGEKGQFRASLKEAQRLILKARKNLADRYGVPDTTPDTPAATASPTEIDDLVRKYTDPK